MGNNSIWIVNFASEKREQPNFPNFTNLNAAKTYCNSVLSDYGKKKHLDGGEILHVVNGEIISKVTVDYVGFNELYYSDVHILHKKIPYKG